MTSGRLTVSRTRRAAGYTLLELLLVLAILSTVAALSFPRVYGSLKSARQEDALYQLRKGLAGLRVQAIGECRVIKITADQVQFNGPNSLPAGRFGLNEAESTLGAFSTVGDHFGLESGMRLDLDPNGVSLLPSGRASNPCRVTLLDGNERIGVVEVHHSGAILIAPRVGVK